MGGEPYLRSINTLYTEMSTKMDGDKVTWVTKEMLPNKGAFQIIYNGSVVYQDWFNGKGGFETNRGEIIETSKEQLADKFPRKNIFNEIDYLDSTIYKIERLADEAIKKIDCYKIKAQFITGRTKILYVEKKSFNIIREDVTKSNSSDISTIYFSDFKKFGNLLFYSKMTLGDNSDAQVATITKLVVNDLISESDFTK